MPICPAGHKVESEQLIYCPICGHKMPTRRQTICPNGHVVAGHHRFCPECGAQLISTRWIWLGGLALALLLFLLVFLAFPPAQVADQTVQSLQQAIDWISTQLSKVSMPGL